MVNFNWICILIFNFCDRFLTTKTLVKHAPGLLSAYTVHMISNYRCWYLWVKATLMMMKRDREEVQAQWTGNGMLVALKKEKDSSDWFLHALRVWLAKPASTRINYIYPAFHSDVIEISETERDRPNHWSRNREGRFCYLGVLLCAEKSEDWMA